MEKPVAAIELCSKCIKIVIGYVLDGKVHVIYTLTKDAGPIFQRGNIIDPVTLKEALESVAIIDDTSAKLRISISDALVAIPPYGVEVFQTKPVVTIISDDGKVSEFDIRNAYASVRKLGFPPNTQLVDIIPSCFVLDQERNYLEPPIGQASSTLQIHSKVLTLPTHIFQNYTKAMEESGIKVRRTMVASTAAVELISSFGDEYPSDYLLVDVGSDMTTVSFVGRKQFFSARFFSWGGDMITKSIRNEFNVDEGEAEKIKMLYGYDLRKLSFDSVVATSEEDGKKVQHRVSDLNTLIARELDTFVRELNNAINSLFEGYPSVDVEKDKALPMVLIGGGSTLYGFTEYLTGKVKSTSLILATPKTLGARNSSYFNCLGMILMNRKYPNAYDDNQKKVTDLGRDTRSEDKK